MFMHPSDCLFACLQAASPARDGTAKRSAAVDIETDELYRLVNINCMGENFQARQPDEVKLGTLDKLYSMSGLHCVQLQPMEGHRQSCSICSQPLQDAILVLSICRPSSATQASSIGVGHSTHR